MNTTVLYVTHRVDDRVLESCARIETPDCWKKILFVDTSAQYSPPDHLRNSVNFFSFSDDVCAPGYHPISNGLIPGSNHFPTLNYLLRSDCEYVWHIEYDVAFSGCWKTFFAAHDDSNADFLTAGIQRRPLEPHWYWWRSLKSPSPLRLNEQLKSFNPIYRLSRTAAFVLALMYRSKWYGHHEATIATCLLQAGCRIEDFGGRGEFTRPVNRGKWYSHRSLRWKQNASRKEDTRKNLLLHPRKP